MELRNKIAIITGASSGIGYAAARLFAKEGAKVVVAARREAELNELVKEITDEGGDAIAVAGNVTDEPFAKSLVDVATREFGGLHITFNNAGIIGTMGATPGILFSQWDETLTTNLTSAFFAAKYQIPAMMKNGSGSMIFTSSFVGYTVGMPGMAAYGASKAGLVGLTRSLAAEFGGNNIRINALLPGGTDTPMAKTFADTPETVEFVKGLHALKRMAQPEEIAQSALFLASDRSSFTTGTAFLVDGGVSMNRT